MSREATRIRILSKTADFLRSLFATLAALISINLIFVGLLLVAIDYATWPVGISVVGGVGFGLSLYALSNLREELRWTRLGGRSRDRCSYCKVAMNGAAFIASPPPFRGIIHSACFPKAFIQELPRRA